MALLKRGRTGENGPRLRFETIGQRAKAPPKRRVPAPEIAGTKIIDDHAINESIPTCSFRP